MVTTIDGEVISIIDGRTSGGTVRRDRDTQVRRKNGVSLGGSVKEEPPGKNAGRAVALIPEGLSSETDPAVLKPPRTSIASVIVVDRDK